MMPMVGTAARAHRSRDLRATLCKVGEIVQRLKTASSPHIARSSLERLERLESAKPKPDEIARGALLGSVVGPVTMLLHRAASGGGPVNPGKRQLAATALNSGLLGGAMPVVTNKVEREAEKKKLQKLVAKTEKTARVESNAVLQRSSAPDMSLEPAQLRGRAHEIVKTCEVQPEQHTRAQKFLSAAKAEAGPAIGAVLGAGTAKAFGLNELAGTAAGYGLGAIPEVVHAIRRRGDGAAKHSNASAPRLRKFLSAAKAEAGPAAGAIIGAGTANAYDVDPLAGAAGGYGLGAIPSIVSTMAKKKAHTKLAGIGTTAPMTVSQYSGPLSFGPFRMASPSPPFRLAALAKADPNSRSPEAWMVGDNKTAASQATATSAMGPLGRLNVTQRVGAPKVTGFSGPSIADISKPRGFGTKLPGALKNRL